VLREFQRYRSEGQFVPFSVGKPTIVFPGYDGGAEWGGAAVDPESAILYVNANDQVFAGTLVKNTGGQGLPGRAIYLSQCSVCHGEKMAGSPPQFPSLVEESKRHSREEISSRIRHGKGRMPSFSNLSDDEISALIDYVSTGGKPEHAATGKGHQVVNTQAAPVPGYRFTGYEQFNDPDGYPAVAPPWGTLNAVNLNTGEYLWQIPLGEYPALAAKGMKDTGTRNYGGPIVTAGGLVFIAATNFDKKMRAFDKDTGKLLWEVVLPFAGNATPATYEVDGRQFVVIAAGGGKAVDLPSGGVYVAFALPR
jgi:quinoprotein glucose dehydrogenase